MITTTKESLDELIHMAMGRGMLIAAQIASGMGNDGIVQEILGAGGLDTYESMLKTKADWHDVDLLVMRKSVIPEVCYQPHFVGLSMLDGKGKPFYKYEYFHDRKNAENAFPNSIITTFKTSDFDLLENWNFVDSRYR